MPLLSTARSFGSLRVKTPLGLAGQRIGVMGGSFNPPHEGHQIVAETAMKRLGLDQVWWLVTPGNPLKSNGDLASLERRMAACRQFARHPRMHVTAFEAELGAPYTAVTMAFLQQRYPTVRFVWLMGADNLASFHRWQSWRRIAQLMPIVVVDRPQWRFRAFASPAAGALSRLRVPEARAGTLPGNLHRRGWTLLSTRLSNASSTAMRARRK
jgi:nicotinate-nucleotide adenylyltransferase